MPIARQQTMRRQAGVALFAFFWALALAAPGNAATAQPELQATAAGVQSEQGVKPVEKIDLKEKWGIEIIAIRLTASDHMVDFRYKVLDPEKAAPLFKRQTKPHLLHAGTGKVLDVPAPAKTGPLRTSDPPKAGRSYWMFFGNGGKLVHKGDKVTVVIGDFRAENLVVE